MPRVASHLRDLARARLLWRDRVVFPESAHLFGCRQELVELTLRLDPPILQHDDPVGPAKGRPAVRDREDCRAVRILEEPIP